VIARLHTRFAGHALLPECRLHGGDLGAAFYAWSVRDALHSLGALRPPEVDLAPEQAALRDRLRERLQRLLHEEPERARAVREFGGPDTLLHGDLWPKNVLVLPAGGQAKARLIDWDRAGVGPVGYDLSTFLGRFPAGERPWILDLYRRCVGRAGWRLPPAGVLNRLFETAECARLANCVIWRALAAREGQAEWAFHELESLEQWLGALQPILPP
jgi:aminoglycoside phosphotransferase (APT) family kinase protein